MTIRDDLYTRLTTGSTTLTALVGTRVYRKRLPQNPTLPALTYWKVSGVRLYDLDGPTGESDPRVQVSCWSQTSAQAEDVAEAVRGTLADWSWDGTVQSCRFVNETDLYDDEVQQYQIAMDFMLMHEE